MTLLYLVFAPVLAAILSFVLTPPMRLLAIRIGAVDHPGPRKVHTTIIPRLGGLAVVASCAVTIALLLWSELPKLDRIASDLAAGLSIGLVVVLMVAIRDDVSPLRAAPKFAAQFVGASLAVAYGIRLSSEVHLFGHTVVLGWFAIPISLLWIAGVTNAFNIVDGLDGLSAGLALLSSISLAAASVMVGQYDLALLALVLAGALVGFLPYNVYPAKVFLGDSGATAIGFTLACLTLRGGATLASGLAVLTPILVVGIPIAETLVSMARRVVRGIRSGGRMGVFEGDANHFHHRLLALGLDQRRAVFVLYGAAVLLSAAGFASLFLSHKKAAVLLATMLAAAVVGLSRLGYDEFALLSKGDLLRVYELPVLKRGLFVVFVDLAIVIISIYGSFVLKYDDWTLVTNRAGLTWLLAVFPPVSLVAFYAFGLYQRMWRLASVSDLSRGSVAVTLAVCVTTVLSMLFNQATPPLTWFAICFLLSLLGMNMSRASYRFLQEYWKRSRVEGQSVVIYGAGNGGAMAVRELLSNPDLNMRPVGFIDDDPALAGKVFSGYPVFGSLDALPGCIPRFQVKGLIVATGKLSEDRLIETAQACERTGIWMRRFSLNFLEGDGVHLAA